MLAATLRERFIAEVTAEPFIFDGSERAFRSAVHRERSDGFTVETWGDGFTLETPDGWGDRTVWRSWDRIRERTGLAIRYDDDTGTIVVRKG